MNKRLHEIQQELATLVQTDLENDRTLVNDFNDDTQIAKDIALVTFLSNNKERATSITNMAEKIIAHENQIAELKLEAREIVNGQVSSKTDNDDLPVGLTVKYSVKAYVQSEMELVQQLAARMPWLLKIDIKALDAFVKSNAIEIDGDNLELPHAILDPFNYSLYARYEATLNISDKELAKADTNVDLPDEDDIPF